MNVAWWYEILKLNIAPIKMCIDHRHVEDEVTSAYLRVRLVVGVILIGHDINLFPYLI